MASNAGRVVLIDGTAMIYRAFFAIPGSFSTSSGIPTNASYGFALMFRKILAGKTPVLGAVVFDAPGKTFRDKAFPEYKAHRPRMMPELRTQLPWVDKIVEAYGFPTYKVEGVEADDVIGTLCKRATAAGHEVHIISGDKDFAQLISDQVRMIDTMRDISYDPELVRKKWGVRPDQFVDYLALVGDKADNIPGVSGIGAKGAAGLLEKYESLDGIFANIEDLKPRQKKSLTDFKDDALMSQTLATIDCKVPLEFTMEDLILPEQDLTKIDSLFRELEFFSLLSESEGSDAEVNICASLPDVKKALPKQEAAVSVLWDGDSIHGAVVGVCVTESKETASYFPVATMKDNAKKCVFAWLSDKSKHKVVHNARDLISLMHHNGIDLKGITLDVGLASYLIDPTQHIPHRLDQVSRAFLHRTLTAEKKVRGSGKSEKRFSEIAEQDVAEFAAEACTALWEMQTQVRDAMESEGQAGYHNEIALPMSKVLAMMQTDGICAAPKALDLLSAEFEKRKATVEAEVYEHAGRSFNLASPKQLGTVLFDELKLPVIKRTKTGYSTAADVLTRLSDKHPIANLVIQHRALAKLINTYTRVLKEAIRPSTKRIHCTFQQTASASGRLITTDPDLQRTPIRTEDGKRIREAFVPKEGHVLISADWSQIELRILAHISEDPLLVDSFSKGLDVHRRTASQIYGIDEEDVDRTQRNVGKTVNFATIYGQGATALGQQLGLKRTEAAAMIERYFEAYSGVRQWRDDTIDEAHHAGYVETLLGRKRYVPELSSNNMSDRAYGERIAVNTPIQGSAADICKVAMLEIATALPACKSAKMLLQIHDELLFECLPEDLEATLAVVKHAMENAHPLSVPLVVDIGHGDSWATAH